MIITKSVPGIDEVPLIGILRRFPGESVVDVVVSAQEAGLRVVEVTLDSPDALDQISRLRVAAPKMTVGAGTVTRPEQVAAAAASGAQFVVSPVVSMPVLAACAQSGVPSIPGAATPTEIYLAFNGGAAAVKVFPAVQLGGPDFLRAIRAPLGDPPLIPTGGVTLENVAQFLAAGAVAVGVGSGLFPEELARSSSERIGEHVDRWVQEVSG